MLRRSSGSCCSPSASARGGVIGWPALLATWLMLGIGHSAAQTPTGRLLRRSASPGDRPAVFAAQFALSHVAWLLTYPLAGWLGAEAGMPVALAVLGVLTLAAALWPASDPDVVEHGHADLRPDHPHLAGDGSSTPTSSTICTTAGLAPGRDK